MEKGENWPQRDRIEWNDFHSRDFSHEKGITAGADKILDFRTLPLLLVGINGRLFQLPINVQRLKWPPLFMFQWQRKETFFCAIQLYSYKGEGELTT